ncbi:MAG: DNA/RNA non-specific endonuclease [Crocinitomicaceae bacterium]
MKLATLFVFLSSICLGQVETPKIKNINQTIDSLDQVRTKLLAELEVLKLGWVQNELDRVGVPKASASESIIEHSAYRLSYNETHEQANWVTHIILPEIATGNAVRSNDFRVDPLVSTGTAIEKDYFLKSKKAGGDFEYDGFGYDRGHLAPSADFRWSEKALSESYFYSNMSPQMGDFNRLKWAELENWMREYVVENNTHLVIVTAPVLTDDLPKIERGINKVSIPNYFVKVALDMKNQRGVGFILPHEKIVKPLESYIVSIDSVESILGYDLFSNLDDNAENTIEAQNDYKPWLPGSQENDILPIALNELPKNSVNTQRVKGLVHSSKNQTVCGTVVSTKKHKKGHVFIDLDKKFPNQVFSVSIFSSSIKNFDFEPEVYLLDRKVCFSGKIGEYNDTPNMIIEHGKQVELLVAD